MSKQLSIAAAASAFVLSALALLSPGSVRLAELPKRMGATIELAAPMVSLAVPNWRPALPFLY